MLVCINGKWGNMNSNDAVALVRIIQPKTVAPMHYGLFVENTVNPLPFLAECRRRGINAVELEVGRQYLC